MSLLRGLVSRALVLTLAVLYGLAVLVRILVGMVQLGPSKLFGRKKRSQPPECLQDPSLGTHAYVHLQDIRMHYVSNGAEDKPLMLLLHGFPEFWYSWRHQLREFKDTYRVVAVDLRGYSETDKPDGVANYALPLLVNDIKQLITALGYEQCVLVGHDWGGAISWELAARYPHLVSRLIVLNCPTLAVFRRHLQSSLTQFKLSWYMFFFQLPWLPELMLTVNDYHQVGAMFKGRRMGVKSEYTTQDDVEAYKYNCSRNSFTAPIHYIRAGFSLDALSRARGETGPDQQRDGTRSEGITMPTLIVWGEADGALDKPMAQLSAQRCKGKVTVRYVEGASHWVQMDRPDLVNAYIREFLEQE